MFGFVNDYLKKFNLKDEDFRLVLIDGSFICIQGFKNILKIDESQVVLKLKSSELIIGGKNLSVKELGSHEIIVVGEILSIER